MARPPLPLGTAGEVRIYPYRTKKGGTRYCAECLYRDYDGVVRCIERRGKSKELARNRLKEAIRDRSYTSSDNEITRDTLVRDLAELWYAEMQALDRSPSTLEQYRYQIDRHIIHAIGELRAHEMTVSLLDRVVKDVRRNIKVTKRVNAKTKGVASARTLRTVLSGMCGMAVRHGALDTNPMRDIGKIEGRSRPASALELDQAGDLRTKIHADPYAARLDLVDFSDMMLGTGFRIGEAAAVLLDACDVDGGTVQVLGTVIRVRGVGLVLKWRPKSEAGYRTVELAAWTVDMISRRWSSKDRLTEVTTYSTTDKVYRRERLRLLFPAPLGGLRDPSNTNKAIKQTFERAGYPDITSHTYRKTVGTLMDQAGLTARAAADQLGHAQVTTTQNHYFGRRVLKTGAAGVLEQLAELPPAGQNWG